MENITTSEHYKTLPEAQDFKEQIVLSLKEIDMKLGQLSEQRHRLMAAKFSLERKIMKVKKFIRERSVLLSPRKDEPPPEGKE